MRDVTDEAEQWLRLLRACAEAVRVALADFDDWSATTERPSQYRLDVVADEAALGVLRVVGVAVLSEESGLTGFAPDSSSAGASFPLSASPPAAEPSASPSVVSCPPAPDLAVTDPVVILDPVDGSTNASRRIPYYCTSLCVLDGLGFAVGLVVNLVDGTAYSAVRGAGAWRNGVPLDAAAARPPLPADLTGALIASNGALPHGVPCAQSRTLGSAALDLCGVAEGRADAFIDPTRSLRVWDYAAGVLICQEAGATVAELANEPLAHTDPARRLGPLATRTSPLMSHLRTTFPSAT